MYLWLRSRVTDPLSDCAKEEMPAVVRFLNLETSRDGLWSAEAILCIQYVT